MKEFYKELLKRSTKDENGFFHFNLDKVFDIFTDSGYYHYVFGGYDHVFTRVPLSMEKCNELERKATKNIQYHVDEITKEINKKILEEILKDEKY